MRLVLMMVKILVVSFLHLAPSVLCILTRVLPVDQ